MTLDEGNFDRRQVFTVFSVMFDDGPHGILQELKEYVVQMGWNIGKGYRSICLTHFKRMTSGKGCFDTFQK